MRLAAPSVPVRASGCTGPTGAAILAVGLAVVLLGAGGCWIPVRPGVSGTVALPAAGPDSVELTYLGVGGWILRRGRDVVLGAPLFSDPSVLRTGLASVRSDTSAVNRYMGRYDVAGAAAILVGHGHYDHLMDVPQIARRHAPHAWILTNRTGYNTLGSWAGVAERIRVVNDLAGDERHAGAWIRLSPTLRVMALRSNHAPHFESFTLYHGHTTRPRVEEPRWASEWLDGDTYAFLVDFLDAQGGVVFRVYYQDAVAAPPRGLAPDSLVATHPVDVAILVPATFDQVDWHPEAFVENLRPRWVLLGHWENFFISPDEPTRSIFLTDLRHFTHRLERVLPGRWYLPDRWTRFVFAPGAARSPTVQRSPAVDGPPIVRPSGYRVPGPPRN